MTLEFSEEEMIEHLLLHGHVIYKQVLETEINIYQNVFQEQKVTVYRAIKNGNDRSIIEAFKKQLLNQI